MFHLLEEMCIPGGLARPISSRATVAQLPGTVVTSWMRDWGAPGAGPGLPCLAPEPHCPPCFSWFRNLGPAAPSAKPSLMNPETTTVGQAASACGVNQKLSCCNGDDTASCSAVPSGT